MNSWACSSTQEHFDFVQNRIEDLIRHTKVPMHCSACYGARTTMYVVYMHMHIYIMTPSDLGDSNLHHGAFGGEGE